jgi:hypothetical protein
MIGPSPKSPERLETRNVHEAEPGFNPEFHGMIGASKPIKVYSQIHGVGNAATILIEGEGAGKEFGEGVRQDRGRKSSSSPSIAAQSRRG